MTAKVVMVLEQRITWLSEQRVEGQLVARVGRRGGELVAEFVNVGMFAARSDGQAVSFDAVPGVDAELVEKLNASLLGALSRHARGELTLHGSAASLDGRALAIVGESGAGKSTLVAALCRSEELRMVADDTVAIDFSPTQRGCPRVLPMQMSAWLLPDARSALGLPTTKSGKSRVELCAETSESLGLQAIVGLRFDSALCGDSPVLRRLRGHEALELLSNTVIRLVVDDPAVQEREFERLRELVSVSPVYELRRRRDLSQVGRCADFLKDLLSTLGLNTGRA